MKDLVILDFPLSGTRLIEASAGTGKTYTMTYLYLRLLLGQSEAVPRPLKVSEILVLTFTIAATQELRNRIRERILEARRVLGANEDTTDEDLLALKEGSSDLVRDTKLLTAALQLMDEASIFTIHAFCARVLGDNAFETGTLFDQDLDADREALLQRATEDCFRSEILTLSPLEKSVALGMWKSPGDLQQQLKPFLFRYSLTMLPPPVDLREELAGLNEKISAVKLRWPAEKVRQVVESAGLNRGRNTFKRLDAMDSWCLSDDLDTSLLSLWRYETLAKNILKGGTVPTHPVLDLINDIAESEVIVEQIRYNLWHLVAKKAKHCLEQYKVDLAQLTLDDLLTRVHDALGQPGQTLASELAKRWPVAMIDEFQDTDDIQYEIFTEIHRSDPAHSLFLVGDPKQAIYQFRGADVFTYINAKRRINSRDHFNLGTNYRSTPAMVSAANTLFDFEDVFDNDKDIPFQPVGAAAQNANKQFLDGAAQVKPITLLAFPPSNKERARRTTMAWAAEETVRLLQSRDATINGKPVTAGNIAFLVRDRNDARAARDALADRDIRSVYVTLESVFLTDTADDLKTILQAVLEPTNERALRAALAVPLLQGKASEILELGREVTHQQRVLQEFLDYHRLWAEMDIAPMIEELMVRREIAQKWFGQPDGERQITNLRHLAELLQQRSSVAPGMHRLLKWFAREKAAADTVASDERQLRLESDRNLVQIVTMHAAKGLEYDIVMIPMAAFAPQDRKDEPCLFHETVDGQFQTRLDFSSDEDHRELAKKERLAEDMRLLYVGITRARYKCYIGIPNVRNDLPKSALKRLLRLTSFEEGEIVNTLQTEFPDELFEVVEVDNVTCTTLPPANADHITREPATPPNVRDNWRLHSYTGISRLIHTEEAPAPIADTVTPGFADDESDVDLERPTQFDRFRFPRGPRAGVALHTLFETLDFTRPIIDQTDSIQHCLTRTGLTRNTRDWSNVLQDWIGDVMNTRLPAGCTLGQVPQQDRLDEMEFHFPLDTGAPLLRVLHDNGYLGGGAGLTVSQLRGSMTGFIDLLFRRDGKYWLVDYKSNHLGNHLEDYTPDKLKEAITSHQYDLQYLIYTVTVHRFLMNRLPGYTYDTHFGGVCYLFIRGMQASGETGVHFDRPDAGFVDKLDAVLGGDR